MRRYFRNKFKSSSTVRQASEIRLQAAIKPEDSKKLSAEFSVAIAEENTAQYLTTTIDTLVSWMEHDVFNKSGPAVMVRLELFNFILQVSNKT